MNFEFQINIRKTNQRKIKTKPQRINKLKQSLVLAHQILNYIEANNLSFHAAAKLTNTSAARISQLINLLSLAPSIQEEILLKDNQVVNKFTERKVRTVIGEIIWDKQIAIWEELKNIDQTKLTYYCK